MIFSLFAFIEVNTIDKKYYKKFSQYIYYAFAFILLFLGTSRYYTGVDYVNYETLYNNLSPVFWNRYEIGFKTVAFFLRDTLHFTFPQFIFVFTSFIILLKYFFINKFFTYKFFILFLYFPAFYLVQDCGQIRQGLALSFTLLSIPYIFERSFIKFCIFALIGTTFHYSAIIFFPIYFIAQYDFTSIKKVWFFTFFSIIFLLLNPALYFFKVLNSLPFGGIFDLFIRTLTVYQGEKSFTDIFFNISFLFRMFVIFLFIMKRDIIINDNPFLWKIFNIYFIGTLIFICFFSISAIAGRGSYYYKVLDIFLLAEYYKYIKFKSTKYFYFSFLSIYGLYKMVSELSRQYFDYIPYRSIFLEFYSKFF